VTHGIDEAVFPRRPHRRDAKPARPHRQHRRDYPAAPRPPEIMATSEFHRLTDTVAERSMSH